MLANIYYEMNDHKNVVEELEKVLQMDLIIIRQITFWVIFY